MPPFEERKFSPHQAQGSRFVCLQAMIMRRMTALPTDTPRVCRWVPSFMAQMVVRQPFASALKDPNSASLQRLQIVKGWIEKGETYEQVYDIACSDGGMVNPETHRCPDNGAKVNVNDCSITKNVGASALEAEWQDPNHNPQHRAFYYVRALENPTCRWSTWDAIKAGVPPRPDLQKTLQERAWTSPIWVMPAS